MQRVLNDGLDQPSDPLSTPFAHKQSIHIHKWYCVSFPQPQVESCYHIPANAENIISQTVLMTCTQYKPTLFLDPIETALKGVTLPNISPP